MEQERFYSKKNIKYLENILQDIENGNANFEEHELSDEELSVTSKKLIQKNAEAYKKLAK